MVLVLGAWFWISFGFGLDEAPSLGCGLIWIWIVGVGGIRFGLVSSGGLTDYF